MLPFNIDDHVDTRQRQAARCERGFFRTVGKTGTESHSGDARVGQDLGFALPLAGKHLSQMAFELVGEVLAVALAERRRPTGFRPAAAQIFHEGAHRQVLGDIVASVELAARIQCEAAFRQNQAGQRNVGGHIGDVEARCHLQRPDEARARHADQLVGHQRHLQLQPVGNAKLDFLAGDLAGVAIDVNLHHGDVRHKYKRPRDPAATLTEP